MHRSCEGATMMRILVVLAACALSAGCVGPGHSQGATSTARERTYVLIDGREERTNVVTVIAGARAFSQEEPFRSPGPPRNLLETQQFPDSVLAAVRHLTERRGRRPPIPPGGLTFTVGRVSPGSPEVAWKYFEGDDRGAADCMDEVRAAMRSLGQPIESIPDWITATPVRKYLAD
jgi:hypothetical protein